MSNPLLPQWKSLRHVVIGMLHAPPLPGAPRYDGNLAAVRERVLADADALATGGVHGLMIENFGDAPFYPDRVPAHVIAHLTALAAAVRARFDLPLGINVLRNDTRSALAIAHAVGAEYVRVNVLCGARVTDQGVIEGIAHELLRDRALLGAQHIRILADVNVKHAVPLGAPRPIEDEIEDTVRRGGADGIVISGAGTGKPTSLEHVQRSKLSAGGAPVFIGSGITAETIDAYLPHADGFIVGTSLKVGGVSTNAVDAAKVRGLTSRVAAGA